MPIVDYVNRIQNISIKNELSKSQINYAAQKLHNDTEKSFSIHTF